MTALRLALFLVASASTLVGCRACSSCYDYSPPVADSTCGTCGPGRAGSVLSGGAVASGEVVYEETSMAPMSPGPTNEPMNSDASLSN